MNRKRRVIHGRVGLQTLLLVPNFFTTTSKREKLIFSSLSITALTLLTTFSRSPLWFVFFILTNIAIVGLVIFSLRTDLSEARFFLIPIFPLTFTAAFLLTMLVIPMHVVLRFGFVGVFGITMYLILLISNIFTIAAVKSIPLMRAAHAASFSVSVVVVFMLLFFVATLKLAPELIALFTAAIIALPTYYLLWTNKLQQSVTKDLIITAAMMIFIIGQFGFVLSFWPISPIFFSLFLTTVFYICTSILFQQSRLQLRQLAEFAAVAMLIFILLVLNAQWGG